MWGTAATRVRKVREAEQAFSSDDMDDTEAQQKLRKSQFREILPIDPRMCAATVLLFPYDGKMRPGNLFSNNLPGDNEEPSDEVQTANIERTHLYDPVFILRMSLHGLPMDYIEPVEYASLGLLAVAFVSLSSPDDDIRKLGYKVNGQDQLLKFRKLGYNHMIISKNIELTYFANSIFCANFVNQDSTNHNALW